MTVDVSLLDEGFSIDIDYNGSLELKEGYNLAEQSANIKITGSVKKDKNNFYRLVADTETEICLLCDRCLEAVKYNIKFSFSADYSYDHEKVKYDEVWYFSGNHIDMSECFLSHLYSHFPMSTLCSDECKGLCHICGENLNLKDCNCDNVTYDPRFEVLRSLFKDKEV